jgi:hypothetical protein
MGKMVQAIVRGPESYFDGELHDPGAIVTVDEDFVSDEDFIEKEIDVTLKEPIVVDGKLQRTFKETVQVPVRFRPLGSTDVAADKPSNAIGGPDVFNVTDFLKGGPDEIIAKIEGGTVDEHLGVIEQGEIARRGPVRAKVKEAIDARLAAISR